MSKPNILAIIPSLFPSTIIGIVKPLLALDRKGLINFRVQLSQATRFHHIRRFDVIVFCRNTEAKDLELLKCAIRLRKKIIYEIDDNLFELDLETELGRYHRYPPRLYVIKSFLKLADLVHVYSKPMEEFALKLNNCTKRINSYFDFEIIKDITAKKDSSKIKIVYATSRTVDDTLVSTFQEALINILEKYQDKVELYIMGSKPSALTSYSNVTVFPYVNNYRQFISFFYENGFDIGLAPLQNDLFYRSKTNNKFREYGACRVAGIYSNVDVYSDCVIDGHNGILVNNSPDEWYGAIEKLVLDHKLRETIIQNAREKVASDYSFDASMRSWEDSLDRLLQIQNVNKLNSVITERKLSILVLISSARDYQSHLRFNSFYEANQFLGNYIDIKIIEQTAFETLSIFDKDLVALFIKDNTQLNEYIWLVNNLHIPVIIDISEITDYTTATVKELSKFKNFCYVSSSKFDHSDLLIRHIPHYLGPERVSVNEIQNTASRQLVSVNVNKDGVDFFYKTFYDMRFVSLAKRDKELNKLSVGEDDVTKINRELEELFYTLKSPLVIWIEIMEQYQGSYVRKRLMERILNKIKKKVRNVLKSQYKKYKSKFSTRKTLLRINRLKRY